MKSKLDKICRIKNAYSDEGTSMQDVRKAVEEGYNHKLRKCLACKGIDYTCKDYKLIKRYRK